MRFFCEVLLSASKCLVSFAGMAKREIPGLNPIFTITPEGHAKELFYFPALFE